MQGRSSTRRASQGLDREGEEAGHMGRGSVRLLGWLPWAQMNSENFDLFK
jgi:hypothetical protein